jgi:chitin disaccharide deacetylase
MERWLGCCGIEACRMVQAVTEAPASAVVEPGSNETARYLPAHSADARISRKLLVVNADDFGKSPAINHAVALAHREGILTSASLMVSGAACAQAVTIARQTPTLAVGLHLVLADGMATLPAAEISHLTDSAGRFRRSATQAGFAYFFSRSARRELAREIRAQFECFARTGLELSHVDGHCHLHMHPAVLDLVLPMAEEFGARAVRIVHDELGVAWAHQRRGIIRRLIWAAEFALLARRRAAGTRWPRIERTFGLMHSGNMTEAYVLDVLRRLPDGASELYFHPSLGPQTDRFGPGPMDLATLLSPAVRQIIGQRGICLTTFPQIALLQRTAFFWQPDSGLIPCSS